MLKKKRNELIVQLMCTDLFHLDYEQLISLTNVKKKFSFLLLRFAADFRFLSVLCQATVQRGQRGRLTVAIFSLTKAKASTSFAIAAAASSSIDFESCWSS